MTINWYALEAAKRKHKLSFLAPDKKVAKAARKKAKAEARRLRGPKIKPPKRKKLRPVNPRPPKLKKRPNYHEYIRSDLWGRVREWKLRLIGWKCERCGHGLDLQVHHKHYRTLGQEDAGDLEVLCRECHRREHEGLIQSNSHLDAIRRAGR